MMNDKQLLQMLEVLGRNSRIARSSKSLAASSVSKATIRDQECAATIRKIVTGNENNLVSRSFAASAPISAAAANSSHNVNRVKTLYNFVINNHLR